MLKQQLYKLELTKEKIKSLDKKQKALDILRKQGNEIHEEMMKWYDENETRDQEEFDRLRALQKQISKQEDDLYKIIIDESEALSPTTSENSSEEEVATEIAGEAEQILPMTELTGDTVDNGPAEVSE